MENDALTILATSVALYVWAKGFKPLLLFSDFVSDEINEDLGVAVFFVGILLWLMLLGAALWRLWL